MSIPSPITSLSAVSNGVESVELRHPEPAASPGVTGYKYFRSGVSSFDATSLAQANAADQSVIVGLVTDPDSPVIGGHQFSRGPVPEMVSIVDLPPSLGQTYYYAAVAWNLDGPSVPTVVSAGHFAPTAPVMVSMYVDQTTLDVVFDQPITSSTNRPGEGFAFLLNGDTVYSNSAEIVGVDTVRFTLAATISQGDLFEVSYDNSVSNLENLTDGASATSFASTAATNNSTHPRLLSAVLAQNLIDPYVISLTFSSPVTSADYLVGLTVLADASPVAVSSVAPDGDPRVLLITLSGSLTYASTITIQYDDATGDWASNGTPLVSLIDEPVTNASKIGTPSSDYPLSSVVRQPLAAKNGVIEATVAVDLNFVDNRLNDRYGPTAVDFGGTFGVSVENPSGVFVPQDMRSLQTGMSVTKKFLVPGFPQHAQVAANEWLATMTTRIEQALGRLRTFDQLTVLGEMTVRQV